MSATISKKLIIVTTSHRPTQRVRSFVKDLASVLPYAVKVNRGKASLTDLYYDAMALGAKRVVIVGVKKGNPGVIRVYAPREPPEIGLDEIAVISLSGVKLRREHPGSQKTFNTRSLGIDIRGVGNEIVKRVADTLVRAFLAKLVVFDEDAEKVDVLMKLHVRERELVMTFICSTTGRICGPTLRVIAVRDNVAGYRVYLPEAREQEIGGSVG